MKVYVVVQITEEGYNHFRAVCKTKEEADALVDKMWHPIDHTMEVLEQDTKMWSHYLRDKLRTFFAKCDLEDKRISISETDIEDCDYYGDPIHLSNGVLTMHIMAHSFNEAESIFAKAIADAELPKSSPKVTTKHTHNDLPEYIG